MTGENLVNDSVATDNDKNLPGLTFGESARKIG